MEKEEAYRKLLKQKLEISFSSLGDDNQEYDDTNNFEMHRKSLIRSSTEEPRYSVHSNAEPMKTATFRNKTNEADDKEN